MFFDLTKGIELDSIGSKRYAKIRALLYVLAIIIMIIIIYLILFPKQTFNYSFVMLTANKGNALNPRDEKGALIQNGKIEASKIIAFDTSPLGKFSKVSLDLAIAKGSQGLENATIDFRKSYKAALYVEGSPIGFKDGSLIRSDGKFFIVSENLIRPFSSDEIISALGFRKESFSEIAAEDMRHNQPGEAITENNSYPDSSLFKIDGNYYQLIDQSLSRFISEKAFLSGYDKNQAIDKNKDFLLKYPVSKNILGFSDGSIISYGESAFIASRGKIYPIGSPEIFVGQGLDWNDIIQVGGDEISLYEKERMLTLLSPHPDGTIFLANDTGKYYVIVDGLKHELPTKNIAMSYLKKRPVIISSKSIETAERCDLIKSSGNSYGCNMSLESSNGFPGQYYEFRLVAEKDSKIDNLNVSYERNATRENLKLSISGMIQKIKSRFGLRSSL